MVKMVLVMTIVVIISFVHSAIVGEAVDCSTVTALLSACSSFIINGAPDPLPLSPCCVAITTLNNLGTDSSQSRQVVCKCLMELITNYNPNATAIATLPGFCGVSLGFTIDPNTDCEYIS
ncbi:putative non-specific lipid-transfer protein 14 [Coffea eugenioides]|uniref:Non-specific lipid-transfer protein 14 n=1 Tax=Coffea arabica TaxID=13443 RepID=A0A6P6W4U2_COFAR|nr:putative non-specific lipid-transfer protein 14 [Coffea arabica]XP_027163951.1 putative non-specific lipid-transfer protein 14 [Coffea eugenioides]XP_027164001.1 putative non-specific lipid-transfer protein 14 [Coffea eugenioides]